MLFKSCKTERISTDDSVGFEDNGEIRLQYLAYQARVLGVDSAYAVSTPGTGTLTGLFVFLRQFLSW